MKKLSSILATTVLFSTFSLSAQAQIKTVIGAGTIEQDCFNVTFYGDMGTQKAVNICDEAISQSTSRNNKAANHVNRGILLMRGGNLDAARIDYEKAIKLKPDLRDAYVNYGALLIHNEDYDGALRALDKAIEGEGTTNLHEALYNRAIVYDRQNRFREAYLDLKRALELRPEWDDAKQAISRYSVAKKSG